MSKLIIPKSFTREFPLILCEAWGKAYKVFFGIKIKTNPAYFFLMKQGLVTAYRSPKLGEEINNIFLDKVEKNPDFLKDLYSKSLEKFNELKSLWDKDFLTKKELIYLFDEFILFWPAIYFGLFIPDCKDFSEENRKLGLDLRSKIDTGADKVSDVIIRTFKSIYPDLGEAVNSIGIDEFKKDDIDKGKIKEKYNKVSIMERDQILSEKELEKLKKDFDFDLEKNIINTDVKEVKGQVACRGKVKGKVHIIFKKDEIDEVKEGEILVTAMTTPDFLPAMKKASALVTDEGGMACHAAIVAREIGKPCIIGTKIATQTLESGDEVEVDADNGVIKIINKIKNDN